jgi:ubiquinone/menaquinone biosynthesis C-methylase UbiE
METITTDVKAIVKEKYGSIAESGSCGCSTACCGDVTNIMAEDYQTLPGYNPDADLGLGCGLPTEFAQIKPGDTVVDLGSGAGNDCFVARALTGETGRVIGIDFTDSMIARANANRDKLGFTNVEFRKGDIDDMPLRNEVADVVVSNCVLNLVPDKAKVFSEIFRVLKTGGHFSISDIVLQGELPEGLRASAEMYAGCVSGAIQKDEYLALAKAAGFSNLTIQKERRIDLPDEVLREYLSEAALQSYRNSNLGILSITLYAEKEKACCGSDCCS